MNVSMIQALQPAKKAGDHTADMTGKNGIFGAVLSQTMEAESGKASALVSSEYMETSKMIESELELLGLVNASSKNNSTEEQLQSLLGVLQIEDVSQIEDSKKLAEALLFATQDQQLSVIFENVGQLFGSESLEQLQSLLSEQSNEQANLLQQLNSIVSQAINEGSINQQRILSGDDGIKLAKVFALFQNVLDLSEDSVLKLEELKQRLEQLTAKLEVILAPKEKNNLEQMMNKNSATVFAGQLFHSDYTKVQASVQSAINNNGDATSAVSIVGANADTSAGTHNPFMNMSKLEQFVLNTQTGDKGSVNSEQLIKSFESIISKAQFTNQNGMQKLFIKLNPEHLGSLRIEIIQQNGTMIAKIIASTQQAKDMLDSQLQGLKQAFVNQNIPVEKLELSQQFNNLSQERNFTRDQGQPQSGGESGSEKSQKDEQVTEQFQTQFEEALLEAEV